MHSREYELRYEDEAFNISLVIKCESKEQEEADDLVKSLKLVMNDVIRNVLVSWKPKTKD